MIHYPAETTLTKTVKRFSKKQMKARGRDVFSNETIRNNAVKCFLWYFIICFRELR